MSEWKPIEIAPETGEFLVYGGLVPKKAVRFGQTRSVTLIIMRAFAPPPRNKTND